MPPTPSVYFLQASIGGPIKIGWSRDVAARVWAMQTGCPFELLVLATMPGEQRQERELHFRFRFAAIDGEWFHPDHEPLRALITSFGGTALEARAWDPIADGINMKKRAPMTVRRTSPPTPIGGYVKALREAFGLSHERFGALAGLDRVDVGRIESGQNRATSARVRKRLSVGFGLDRDTLDALFAGSIELADVLRLSTRRPTLAA